MRRFATDAYGRLWRTEYAFWDRSIVLSVASLVAVTFPGHEGET
jgi:hypothetical protein